MSTFSSQWSWVSTPIPVSDSCSSGHPRAHPYFSRELISLEGLETGQIQKKEQVGVTQRPCLCFTVLVDAWDQLQR